MLKTLKNADENAYPQGSHSCGLTKRELFAAMAMQAWIATPGKDGEQARGDPKCAAAWAIENADALLTELHNQGNGQSRQDDI